MAATRYGSSCWLEAVPRARRPSWPRLRGDAECDVAIVGGGLAGCAAAYVFAQAGVRVTLVEAARLGQGFAAGGTGLIDAGAGARFADLRQRHGLRAARHMWETARLASLDIQALVRRLGIRCGLERLPVTDVALGDADAAMLEREFRELAGAGFSAAWLKAGRVRAAVGLEAAGALKRGDAGWADPYRLSLGFAHHAERKGATVFEQTAVRRIKIARRHVDVVSGQGTLRAAAVLVATGLPQPGLAALHRHLRAVDATTVILPSLPGPVRRAFGQAAGVVRDSAELRHAWRFDRSGQLVAWQTDQPPAPARQRPGVAIQRSGQLMYELSTLYPSLSGQMASHGCCATAWRSGDGMVIAGPHRSFPRHLFAVGLGADGLQGAYLAARLNLRHYLGAAETGDELFGFVR